MGLHVIAEGVESTEQRDLLANLGCHHFQGYCFSAALAEPDFLTLLARGPVIDAGALAAASRPTSA